MICKKKLKSRTRILLFSLYQLLIPAIQRTTTEKNCWKKALKKPIEMKIIFKLYVLFGWFCFLSSCKAAYILYIAIPTITINLVCAIKMAHRYKSRKRLNKLLRQVSKTKATETFAFIYASMEYARVGLGLYFFSLLFLIHFVAHLTVLKTKKGLWAMREL